MTHERHATGSGRTRLREFTLGVFVALPAFGLATLPAAARAGDRLAPIAAWLFAWAGTSLVLSPFAGALRAVWPPRRSILVASAALVSVAAPLALIAEVLKRTTHHRALGATTFSIIALALVIAALALAARALGRRSPRWVRAAAVALVGLAAVALLVLMTRAAGGGNASRLWPHILDATLIVGSLALACGLPWPRRIPGWLAALSWAAVVGAGFAAARAEPRISTVMREVAPVAAGVGALTAR